MTEKRKYRPRIEYVIEASPEANVPYKSLQSLQGYPTLHIARLAALGIIIRTNVEISIWKREGGIYGSLTLDSKIQHDADAVRLLKAILDAKSDRPF